MNLPTTQKLLRISRWLASAGLSALISLFPLRADTVGVQVTNQGALTYPNQGPTSVGNETQEGFASGSGFVAGDATASVTLNETRSGTDASAGPGAIGTSGTSSFSLTTNASLGHLDATSSASASSWSNGGSTVFYPHGAAAVNPLAGEVARFDDVTTVFNPNYALGTLIPVELTLDLNWDGGFDLGAAGFNFAQSGATAFLAVQWVGNVSAYDLKRSDTAPGSWDYASPQTLSFAIGNGGSFAWATSLTVFDGVSLGGVYGSSEYDFPTVAASVYSNASIDIMPTSAWTGTTFASNSGHVYEEQAEVPDTAATALLLAVGMIGIGCQLRRRPNRARG